MVSRSVATLPLFRPSSMPTTFYQPLRLLFDLLLGPLFLLVYSSPLVPPPRPSQLLTSKLEAAEAMFRREPSLLDLPEHVHIGALVAAQACRPPLVRVLLSAFPQPASDHGGVSSVAAEAAVSDGAERVLSASDRWLAAGLFVASDPHIASMLTVVSSCCTVSSRNWKAFFPGERLELICGVCERGRLQTSLWLSLNACDGVGVLLLSTGCVRAPSQGRALDGGTGGRPAAVPQEEYLAPGHQHRPRAISTGYQRTRFAAGVCVPMLLETGLLCGSL